MAEKLTKRAIERLPAPHPSGKQHLVWDADLKGFGVLLSGKTTGKSFVVQHKLPGGLTRRVTIGPVNALDLDGPDGARARAKALLGEFYRGTDPKTERKKAARRGKTFGQAFEEYLASRKDLSARSAADYRKTVDRWLADWRGLPLHEIDGDAVEAKHTEIATTVKRRRKSERSGGGQVTGGASANMAMRTFRAIWNHARDRDPALPEAPTRRLRRSWYAQPRRERLVTADQLPAFFAAVDRLESRTARDFLLLLLYSGFRKTEAAAVKWSEIDFAGRLIRLPAARAKSRRRLDLPMSSYVRYLMVARRALGVEGDFVFPADSRSGHIEHPAFPLKLVAEQTGIAVSPHDLRRTYITVAESSDISPLALKCLVNHSLGGDVTSGYVQMTVERLREPAQRVCDKLMELCGIAAPATGNVEMLA